MAEEKKEESASNPEEKKEEVTEEKETNKTYTQSDFDKEVARQMAEFKVKHGDPEKTKKELANLIKWKKEKEEEALTEQERIQKRLDELKDESTSVKRRNQILELQLKTKDILSESKYSTLPRVYKNMVQGESEEEIRLNAEKIMTEYQDDLKKIGKTVEFVPPEMSKTPESKINVKSLKDLKNEAIEKSKNRFFDKM
jgi:hypothetical protein